MITSPNGKQYVGQAFDIFRRWSEYFDFKKCNRIVYNSLKKYGPENHKFEVLMFCDIIALNDMEAYFQRKHNVLDPNGMNCRYEPYGNKRGEFAMSSRINMSNAQKHFHRNCSAEQKTLLYAGRGDKIAKTYSKKSVAELAKRANKIKQGHARRSEEDKRDHVDRRNKTLSLQSEERRKQTSDAKRKSQLLAIANRTPERTAEIEMNRLKKRIQIELHKFNIAGSRRS